jgi:hypothetical protein
MAVRWRILSPLEMTASSEFRTVNVYFEGHEVYVLRSAGRMWKYLSLPDALLAGEELLKDPEHWKEGKQEIAIAFDGCIHSYLTPWTTNTGINDPPTEGTARALQRLSQRYDITVVSGRAHHPDGLSAVISWLKMFHLHQYIKKVVPPSHSSFFVGPLTTKFEGSWWDSFPAPEKWNRRPGWRKTNRFRPELQDDYTDTPAPYWDDSGDRFDGIGD